MARKRDNAYTTSNLESQQMGQAIDTMMKSSRDSRRSFERRWYDNNFFDDGLHFRFLSRSQNKIVDLSERSNIYAPMRAIPKASRQIRGVANLLTSKELVPVVYPENVNPRAYDDAKEFTLARDEAKRVAQNVGHWITEEYKVQEIKEKLPLMLILAAKHGISFMQVWPDAVNEKLKTRVYDAFDIFIQGDYTQLEDVPYIIKGIPKLISVIKANENFDKDQVEKITADNKLASSEIKDAYMSSRYGKETRSDESATVILKEAFVKEYLNDNNRARIKKQENGKEILGKRQDGDPVIRQVFVAGNIWLRDEYLDMTDYPFVEYRYEPGPLYHVPMIERFMSANKSLDTVISRIERYLHTMVVGTWMKRQGEQVNITNQAGGQIIEYKSTPPVQGNIAPMPNFVFNYIGLLNSFIEEQGVTTSALGKIPSGVESGKAIESLKESEFANLVIADDRVRKTIKNLTELFVKFAYDFFNSPQTVKLLEKGEPQYFDIISAEALKKRKDLGISTPKGINPIHRDIRVEVETQTGLAYTREGQKLAARELGDYMVTLAQNGLMPPAAVTKFIEVLLEAYQFGPTKDFIESFENAPGKDDLNTEQLNMMKVAMAEVVKDTGLADPQRTIDATKVGVAEVAKDMQKGGGQNASQG